MYFRYFLNLIILLLLSVPSQAEEALIDLRGEAWGHGEIHSLEARWDFYWQQLLSSEDIQNSPSHAVKFPVPGSWSSPPVGVEAYPGEGYGTYKVVVVVPKETSELFLSIPDMASAYQLWSNGRLIAANGVVGTTKDEEIPAYLPKVVSLNAEDGKIELVLQTSNFHYQWGGVWYNLQLTDESGVDALREKPIIMAMLYGTLLLSASLFSLFIFASRPKERVLLYFGLLCLSMGVRRLLIDERVLYFYDWFSWPVFQSLENLCTYLAFPLFISYFSYRFPVESSRRARILSWVAIVPFCVLALVSDVSFYTQFNVPFQIMLLVSVPYILFTYGKVLMAGKRGAAIFGLGLFIFSATVINDILTYSYIIHTPNLSHFGMLAFVIFQAMDLTKSYMHNFAAIEKMSKALKLRNQELVRIDAFKDEFLATTSHELRTPLHGISGLASHLIDDEGASFSGSQRHKLDLIASTTKRLGTLVNDILDFSSIKHGNLSLHKRRVDLQVLAEVVINTLSPLLAGRDICLTADIAPDARYIEADENRLQQILFNILGNSVKFTDEGFIQLNITRADESVMVEIVDTGMGISPEKRDLLFQPFNQIHETTEQTYSGAGLGLSISRQLIEMHGGELNIESQEGYGTTVRFALPLASADANEPSAPMLGNGIDDAVTPMNPVNLSVTPTQIKTINSVDSVVEKQSVESALNTMIFVVDDEEVNRALVKAQLMSVGYQVESFTGGCALLERLAEQTPDLVLLDLMMPTMNGLEVCKRIREHQDRYELPVMMLTARYQVTDIVDCLNAGANDYLVKPYHEMELLARVNSQLSTRQFWFSDKENKRLKVEIDRRKEAEGQLSAANRRLLNALDVSDESIVLVDEDFYTIYANQHALGLFAINASEMVGHIITPLLSETIRASMEQHWGASSDHCSFTVNDASLGQAIHCQMKRFNEAGERFIAMVFTPALAIVDDHAGTVLPDQLLEELTRELAEGRQKFEHIEEVLKQVSALSSSTEKQLLASSIEGNSIGKAEALSESTDKREGLVKLLRTTLGLWERYTQKSKADLADESRCWRVYVDGTTAKTRTLDRYLSTKTLPEKPRWRLVIRTANYVVDHCHLSLEDYQELSQLIDLLDDAYS